MDVVGGDGGDLHLDSADAFLGRASDVEEVPVPPPPERAALRRRWANLIRRVYETDPLVCPRCGAEIQIIGFIAPFDERLAADARCPDWGLLASGWGAEALAGLNRARELESSLASNPFAGACAGCPRVDGC